MRTYYHVTFAPIVKKILWEGLVPQKKAIWSNRYGFKLGLRVVYAYADYESAVRWAYRQTWHFNKKTMIIVFKEDESVMKRPETYISGEEFYKEGVIPVEQIVDVLDVNSETYLH